MVPGTPGSRGSKKREEATPELPPPPCEASTRARYTLTLPARGTERGAVYV